MSIQSLGVSETPDNFSRQESSSIMKLKMGGLKAVLLLLGVFMCVIPFSYGLSESCMMVYDEGRAPAVHRSPECSDWVLSAESRQNQKVNCQFSTTQGRRRYQEDHISCNLDMKIPLSGENGPKNINVGVVAVFDGHIGKEASEMASKLFMDYFHLHSVFGLHKNWLSEKEEQDIDEESELHSSNLGSSEGILPVIWDGSVHMQILKEALEAFKINSASGTTAVVVLLVDGQILVANVGDSKALLCSETQDDDGSLKAYLSPKELTIDHTAHRDEERSRIEQAGGVITGYGLPLINGHFPMTRAIGDVPLKTYGIISDPELRDWQALTANDSYLVISSDGIFESLNPKHVCELLQGAHSGGSKKSKRKPSCSSESSLADCIVREAFKKGSTDNLSVVVVPLRSAGFSPMKY
ncbi:Protein phosphatase 2C 51 [Actinidia chinensis var. chinensis]|uniref:Protein phosphatase 2C 51 n=1 Tax=Actinidia chinensis var. chinensis TaxID=1590841 RepID=A0A2R6QF77_ACTCC|nr:Protein phosphatase 2C 51 [Actinidia chinensis var. chinensis]